MIPKKKIGEASMFLRAIATVVLLTAPVTSRADSVEDFYKGHPIQMIVGYGAGGGYDVYARIFARYLGAHMPGNPTVIVQNMPGAGSLRAANYIYSVAPKDGATIVAIDRQVPFSALLGTAGPVPFDPRKVTWIGALSSYANDAFLLFVRKDAPAKTLEDMRRPGGPETTIGGSADGSTDNDVINLLRIAAGMNLKLISGYPDGNSISLALERGEVHARMVGLSSAQSTRPEWLRPDSIVHPMVQFGRATRHPDFPDVPTARELAKDERSRLMIEIAEMPYKLSRPYIAPPGIPPERTAALQNALMEVAKDPRFLEEAAKLKIDISPAHGSEAATMIERISSAPPETLEALKKLFGEQSQR
jgi:tripartite-type tricarboxylate transporter receptor subunit TctC